MGLIVLLAVVVAFVTSCTGLGYLADSLARRRGWKGLARGFISAAIVCIWPAILLGDAFYDAATHQRLGPSDPGDGPVYVLMGVFLFVPSLFAMGFLLTLFGARRGWRKSLSYRNTA